MANVRLCRFCRGVFRGVNFVRKRNRHEYSCELAFVGRVDFPVPLEDPQIELPTAGGRDVLLADPVMVSPAHSTASEEQMDGGLPEPWKLPKEPC